MRKAFLVGLVLIVSVRSVCAQTTVTLIEPPFKTIPIKISIIGSLNSSTAYIFYPHQSYITTQSHSGFGIGAQLESQFEGNLFFTPAAMINNRGYGYTEKATTGAHLVTKDLVSMYFFDITPSFTYKLDFAKWQPDGKIYFSFGPEFGFAIHGTEKKTVGSHATVKTTMKFSYSTYSYVDIGLAASVGYHNKIGFAQIGYQYGVANIDDNAPTDKGNIQTRMLSFSLGYYLKHSR